MNRLAFVTDMHFGPLAYFEGKLRKMSHEAPVLLRRVIDRLRQDPPDLLVNLGDDIEDEGREQDLARYGACQEILRSAGCPLVNVAGNHDTINLDGRDLNKIWGREGPLYYSLELGNLHLVVLHTVEHKDVDIRIDDEQLAWLREDLAHTRRDTVVLMHHSASEQDLSDTRWFHTAPHLALVQERSALRWILRQSGVVRAVFNGHLHRNHLDVIDGIPYITVQSLIENLEDDAPGRPAASYATALLDERRLVVRVHGNDPARYQIERSP
ncbi:MAG: metallophosphoesterase [Myxococcales bacterium]|nr:metallophosphoesterase [Polyangiaceae bacterium]MDW8249018.1 metallophosphoesterase [Myxococcales bacterium]